jgi:serine O-acetyltransferase
VGWLAKQFAHCAKRLPIRVLTTAWGRDIFAYLPAPAAILRATAPGQEPNRELSMPTQPLRVTIARKQEVYPLEDDAAWNRLRAEAQQGLDNDPALASLYLQILNEPTFEQALIHRLATLLGDGFLPAEALGTILVNQVHAEPSIGNAMRADIAAVAERDPATSRLIEPFLFYKGFAAIQAHRFVHVLWTRGKRDIALYLQSRSSDVFHTDIHPAAMFGNGIFLDHATGFVAGETVLIEDNVSILHGVTLGGSGIHKGQRHPKVRTGVLIGAGAQILGPIEIGAFSKIAAGSLVTKSVPPRSTAVGVPAKIIEGAGAENPAENMNQALAEGSYESFTYVI